MSKVSGWQLYGRYKGSWLILFLGLLALISSLLFLAAIATMLPVNPI